MNGAGRNTVDPTGLGPGESTADGSNLSCGTVDPTGLGPGESTAAGSNLPGGMVETRVRERVDPRRLFRGEGAISDGDMRVDVAQWISQLVLADERKRLEAREMHVRGRHVTHATERTRRVAGDHVRAIKGGDDVQVHERMEETVLGTVTINAQVESESIVGGSYTHMVTGGFMRMAAWIDYLVWGGWLEADVVRIEMAGAMIRSYMGYAHVAGVRIMASPTFIDDLSSRTETFGTCMDMTSGDDYFVTPGGGKSMET